MRTIYNRSVDPYFNIAAEEYLVDNYEDDIIMLWRNAPSVIIGKNQNAWAEVNVPFVTENAIPVVRRITGGGAVFHDLGNVNFSFITRAEEDTKLNFEKFSRPIIDALSKVGIDASLDGRNDLVAEGYKISGNAECVRRSVSGANAMLHHGTILFSADMSKLAGALRVDPEKIKSKGIASVRGRVKNITGLEGYRGPEDVEDFISHLFGSVSDKRPEGFSEEEARAIAARRDGKFATWEWNFGASPAFDFENKRRFSFGTVTAAVLCRGGRIEDVKFYGDFFGTADKELLENVLTGTKYDREKIFQKLEDNRALVESCISGALPQDIADLLFK